jgi:hypothetical protein
MKTHKLLVLLLTGQLLASGLAAQTADDLVSAGRTCLVAHNLIGAYSNFNAAVALSPTNEAANALVAVTRILVLPQQPAGSNFLNSLKLSTGGRDIYNWTSTFPHDINGHTMLPTNNTSVAIAFYRTNIMVALAASRTNLAQITDPNFTLSLTKDETSIESVTVDYGDFLLMQTLERVAEFAGYTLTAHNFNFVFSHLQDLDKTNGLTIQKVLSDYPSLLNLSNTTDLATSKGIFTNAIVLYQQASDFIRNIRPPGAVRLFNLDPGDLAKEATFRANLTNFLLSLNAPTEISPSNANAIASTAYLGAYFSGTRSLRSLIPQFNGNAYVNDTLPDYTFGGIVPDWPAYQTEAKLRKMFYSYAGIYGGHVNDLTYNDPYAGFFGVFIGTNGQATVIGYDVDSFQNIDETQSGGVAAQFNVDPHGNWQFNSNSVAGVSGYGSVSKDGSFSGELDFTNGDSVSLNGCAQRALENGTANSCYSCHDAGSLAGRSFQNAAGNYGGTYSMKYQGQTFTGKLQAILSDAGALPFCFFDPSGAQNDGGAGLLGSNNKFTTTNATSGDVYTGTLNLSTFQITGTMTNRDGPYGGTYTLTRSANVPFDVPPAITTPPQNKNVTAGSNVTFSVTATGSAPLCYQWYCNDSLILGATSASFVVTNAPLSASGNSYSVSINNVVGGTNATANLIVAPETVKPTLQITAPTSGLHVSNANYTVTGTAGDNVAVSNVWYQLNNTGWNPAIPANQWTNWTAPVTLVQGSNTIQAYAVDTSGNVSTTNTVIFDYIVSGVLTVNTNGKGTVSPNYNGGWLQIGQNYAMTATAGSGFAFVNWTGSITTNGATLQFTMASNLTFTANFVDVAKPTNTITAPTAGQRWSNSIFTVTGTASDNVQVAGVWCQLNGGGWNNAVGTTSWSALVNLLPGTNLVQAYAVDLAGNKSTTNSVNMDCVATNQLQVRMTGRGTISPNYSNAWLEIGRNYSITSTPASGFAFSNWVTSTNWTGGAATTKTNLPFMMAANLTLQVTFLDVTKPTLSITAPAAGQHMTNAVATVVGTASDNWKVSTVWYQLTNKILTGGTWSLATTTNNYTNWTAIVTLAAGTNTVKAYAVDLGGNYSTTSSVSVLSSNTFKLQLNFAINQPMTSTGLNFTLQISSNLNGRVQVSTNLTSWTTLTNFVGTNTTLNFRDPQATNSKSRFYRAVIP